MMVVPRSRLKCPAFRESTVHGASTFHLDAILTSLNIRRQLPEYALLSDTDLLVHTKDMEHVGRSSSPNDGPTQRGNWPFMNHNAATLPNNLPPNVDDKPLARQKRKRTSPEDQAVLEAYYARDPKPDKAARVDLVQHVALGEKEVQVSQREYALGSRELTATP